METASILWSVHFLETASCPSTQIALFLVNGNSAFLHFRSEFRSSNSDCQVKIIKPDFNHQYLSISKIFKDDMISKTPKNSIRQRTPERNTRMASCGPSGPRGGSWDRKYLRTSAAKSSALCAEHGLALQHMEKTKVQLKHRFLHLRWWEARWYHVISSNHFADERNIRVYNWQNLRLYACSIEL